MRSLSLMDKNKATSAADDNDTLRTTTTSEAGQAQRKTPAGLIISVNVEAQDQMIRRKRKSLALRLKERVTRRVNPAPVTEGWSKDHGDQASDDDESHQRGSCFGC